MSSSTDHAPGHRPDHVRGRGRSLLTEQILAIAFAQGRSPREGATLDAVLESLRPYPPLPAAALAAVAEIVTLLHGENARAVAAAAVAPAGHAAGQDSGPDTGPDEGTPASWT